MTIERPYVSPRMGVLFDVIGPFVTWASRPDVRGASGPGIANFMFGNPHDMAPQAYVDALVRGSTPTAADHFAYKMNEEQPTRVVAASLTERFSLPFDAEDVFLTNGNFSGLSICLHAVTGPGDEVVYVSPPWFFYETLILESGATPVRVPADQETWDLDLDAIAAAIGPRTAAIIVNSPNNPTGEDLPTRDARRTRPHPDRSRGAERSADLPPVRRGLQPDRLRRSRLSDAGRLVPVVLLHLHLREDASRAGAPVRVRRGAADDARPRGPARTVTPRPGCARLGVPGSAAATRDRRPRPDPGRHRPPPATARPPGPRAPRPGLRRRRTGGDVLRDRSFADPGRSSVLRCSVRHDVYVLPGSVFEMPGWFRLSVTANDDMCERAVPAFAKAIAEVRS